MNVTDNQSCIIRPKSCPLKAYIQVKCPQNAIKIIHLTLVLSMPGSSVAMAACLWRQSCLQSCFSIQQWSVALRFEVAPPCRELITWWNEQALAVPEKCLREQRLLGRGTMWHQSTYSKLLCNGGQSPFQKVLYIVQHCRNLLEENWNCWCIRGRSSPACYLSSSKKLKFRWVRRFCNFKMYRTVEARKMLAYMSGGISAFLWGFDPQNMPAPPPPYCSSHMQLGPSHTRQLSVPDSMWEIINSRHSLHGINEQLQHLKTSQSAASSVGLIYFSLTILIITQTG